MSEIEYLYRYTSIESLALMLKSKAVRLNPLDKILALLAHGTHIHHVYILFD